MKCETVFSKRWIIEEFIRPLVIFTRLITCEGRFSTFKPCHFRLLAHFEFGKLLNFPFYFWKSLGKMDSQVKKNVENPTHSLYHHGLIKMVILAELKKKKIKHGNNFYTNCPILILVHPWLMKWADLISLILLTKYPLWMFLNVKLVTFRNKKLRVVRTQEGPMPRSLGG